MIRPLADNCLLILEPDLPEKTAGGIYAVALQEKGKAYGNRIGYVLAVGPGHWRTRPQVVLGRAGIESVFVPTETHPGERVVIRVNAGDRYTYVKRQDMAEMYGAELDARGIPRESAEFRMVREAEILAVIEEVREGAAAAE